MYIYIYTYIYINIKYTLGTMLRTTICNVHVPQIATSCDIFPFPLSPFAKASVDSSSSGALEVGQLVGGLFQPTWFQPSWWLLIRLMVSSHLKKR